MSETMVPGVQRTGQSMYLVAGWSAWCLVVLMALYFWARMGIDFYTGYALRYSDCLCALAYTLLCTWFFIIGDWNKLQMLWLAILPLLCLVAPRFAAEIFSPRRRKRMATQLAAARHDVDMTSRAGIDAMYPTQSVSGVAGRSGQAIAPL